MMKALPGSALVVVQSEIGFVALKKLFRRKTPAI